MATKEYFPEIGKIKFEGKDSKNPLAFHYYDAEKVIMGKPMKEWLRFAMCWWHTLCADGADQFGSGTKTFPWSEGADALTIAKQKADAGFEIMTKLGFPYFCFHDVDLISEGNSIEEYEANLKAIVAYLKENFAQLGDNIIEQDFLKMDLSQLFDGNPFVLTGNYPYNISSQIFFKMLDYKNLIPCCTGMIQKEVAERIAAAPGSKTYGILSVLIQAWYHVEYLFTVHENVFNPPPKVKSAVIRMTRNETMDLGCNEKLFKQIVKTTFNQRRKTLRNSISTILDKTNPLSMDPIFNKRPEQLSVKEFIDLTNRVEEALKQQE